MNYRLPVNFILAVEKCYILNLGLSAFVSLNHTEDHTV